MSHDQDPPTVARLRHRADTLQTEIDHRRESEVRLTETVVEQTRKATESNELLRLLVESVIDYAIFMLDPRGNVATWNAGAERIKGYSAAEIIGTHFSRFYPESDVQAGKCELELAVATRVGRFEDEGWRVRKDGSTFWANVVISRVDDGCGTLVGFSKVTRDLTERRHIEQERAARLAAEQANRTKDEFLAMLGHELRNPLAPIVTALQLMKLRGDGGSLREQEIIERQVKHMINLVDDLLDVERITRGHIELKQQIVNVRDVIARAIETASPLLEQRGHHLDVKIPDGTLHVRGDQARLTQVFTNLITNAAKYTDPGGHICVDLACVAGEIVVDVRDDGIGIDPALLPEVFALFVQGSRSSERAGGGLGLGLTLVRGIVALHGGTVTARSEGCGLGSCFTVRLTASSLPVDKRITEPAVAMLQIAEQKRRILLVDDNDDALVLLCDLLVSVGYEVRTAGDAVAAMELVGDFAPDVAILDIGLPVVDGYELAARLRSKLASATPRLIALTGYGQQVDQVRSRDAGFDVHLVKPVDVQRLLASIAS